MFLYITIGFLFSCGRTENSKDLPRDITLKESLSSSSRIKMVSVGFATEKLSLVGNSAIFSNLVVITVPVCDGEEKEIVSATNPPVPGKIEKYSCYLRMSVSLVVPGAVFYPVCKPP